MKKKKNKTASHLKILSVISAIFLAHNLSFAGVAGSKHDMYSLGKGTDPNVCSYCHIPHKAAGDKIWSTWANEAQLTSGPSTTIGNMCYTCHDGTATSIGQTTAFNVSLQQHKVPSGQDCDMCHSVHDNTNGMFMNVAEYQNSFCVNCHNAAVNAGGLGDMSAVGNHPSYWVAGTVHQGPSTGAFCTACHFTGEVHGQVVRANSCCLCHAKAHGAVNYSRPGLSNPILRIDNTDSNFCATCHPINMQISAGGTKHPANLSSGGTWGKVICQDCHDPHQPQNPNNPFILRDQNVDSAYCAQCHDPTSTANGPKIGNGHPVGLPFSMTPVDTTKTPAGNSIDDDGFYGIDYPANSSNVICETCHSMHRKGTGSPLLRIDNSGGVLCLNCHTDK